MQQLDARLVTPEAVVLQFETAGLGSRFLARLLDTLIQGTALMVLFFVAGVAGSGGMGATPLMIFFLLTLFAVLFAYPAVLETLWRGRTVGKAALGLRVVTSEGAPIRFRHAAIRSALWLVDGLVLGPAPAVIAILASRDNLRLGDMAAGTIVVRERTGARTSAPVTFTVPPGCEPYVATLDVSSVTAEDYEAVRALLLRAPTLPPHVRADLAGSLGNHLAARMRHRPPEWAGPELFLACVAVAFQRRFSPPGPRGGAPWDPAPVAPPSAPWALVPAAPSGAAPPDGNGGGDGFVAPA